jgi:hypothetical protein
MVVYDDTLPLDFGDDDPGRYDPLDIKVRACTIAELRRAMELTAGGGLLPTRDVERYDDLVALVGSTLVSWNLDDPASGDPLPADAEHLAARPALLVGRIINAWIDAQLGLSAPLGQPSNDGAPEAEIPQTPLAS